MKSLKTYSILLLLFIMGCSSEYLSRTPEKYQSKEDFLNYLMGGYFKDTQTLYDENCMQLKDLRKGLGLDKCDRIYTVAMGKYLIFENYEHNTDPNELSVLVLSADAPPVLIRSINELMVADCRVTYYNEKEGLDCLDKGKYQKRNHPYTPIRCALGDNDYLEFHNGHTIKGANSIFMDDDLRFVCYRKLEKPLNQGGDTYYESEPIYITSVDNPKIKLQSHLKWMPETMIIHNNKLYLGTVTWRKKLPVFHFEVFDIVGDDELQYITDYYVNPPWGSYIVCSASMHEYDPHTNSQIIDVDRELPFRHSQYLYSYEDKRFRDLPLFRTFRFINPAILRNSIQYVDLDKVNALTTQTKNEKREK